MAMISQNLGHLSFSDLMVALHFTEEDVEANRQGYMSDAQRGKIRHKILEPMSPMPRLMLRLFILIILLTPFIFVFIAFKDSASNPNAVVSVGPALVSDL